MGCLVFWPSHSAGVCVSPMASHTRSHLCSDWRGLFLGAAALILVGLIWLHVVWLQNCACEPGNNLGVVVLAGLIEPLLCVHFKFLSCLVPFPRSYRSSYLLSQVVCCLLWLFGFGYKMSQPFRAQNWNTPTTAWNLYFASWGDGCTGCMGTNVRAHNHLSWSIPVTNVGWNQKWLHNSRCLKGPQSEEESKWATSTLLSWGPYRGEESKVAIYCLGGPQSREESEWAPQPLQTKQTKVTVCSSGVTGLRHKGGGGQRAILFCAVQMR